MFCCETSNDILTIWLDIRVRPFMPPGVYFSFPKQMLAICRVLSWNLSSVNAGQVFLANNGPVPLSLVHMFPMRSQQFKILASHVIYKSCSGCS